MLDIHSVYRPSICAFNPHRNKTGGVGMTFILWAVYHCFKLLDNYIIYYYCVWVLFCGVVFLIRVFFKYRLQCQEM